MSDYKIQRWREIYAPNAAMLRIVLEREGYRVYQWADRPEMAYGLHKHHEDQTHWIVSGALELTIEKVGTFTLEAGDRDFLPAETYHTARVVGEESVIYLVGEKI
jgi:mannose-6-phosphate isomerase-like protein (cupin superfamily)